jgi:hypothetical protein
MTKGGDHPVKATVGKTKDAYTQTLPTYPDTPATEHALVRVINKHRAAGIHRQIAQKLPQSLRLKLNPQVSSYFLKLAGTASGAMSTIHHIARQKQLKGSASQP